MSAEALFEPEPLNNSHDVREFDCSVDALNRYLTGRAVLDQEADNARTFVAPRGSRVVAFYSLAASSVDRAEVTPRLAETPSYSTIPVFLIGRLAVDRSEQSKRPGEAMLVNALLRCAQVADTIAARAVLVHAKDDHVRGFYERYGFEESPTHPLHLFMPMQDVRLMTDTPTL